MIEELNPCPFCGEQVTMDITQFSSGTMAAIFTCTSCGAQAAFFGYDDVNLFERKMVERWNRRAEKSAEMGAPMFEYPESLRPPWIAT